MDLASFYAVDKVGAMVAKEVEKNASEVEEVVFKKNWQGRLMFPLMKEVPSLLFLISFCFHQENFV